MPKSLIYMRNNKNKERINEICEFFKESKEKTQVMIDWGIIGYCDKLHANITKGVCVSCKKPKEKVEVKEETTKKEIKKKPLDFLLNNKS